MTAHNKAEAAGRYWVAVEFDDGRTEYDGRVYESEDEAERRLLSIIRRAPEATAYICTI